MTQIVEGTHNLHDTAGNPVALGTITEANMRIAALVALQIATGETIWPADRKIIVHQRRPAHEIFEEARS